MGVDPNRLLGLISSEAKEEEEKDQFLIVDDEEEVEEKGSYKYTYIHGHACRNSCQKFCALIFVHNRAYEIFLTTKISRTMVCDKYYFVRHLLTQVYFKQALFLWKSHIDFWLRPL